MNRQKITWIMLIAIIFFVCPDAFAGWDAGAKAGFDSNVNRSVEEERSDSYLTGYLSFGGETKKRPRPDWTIECVLEGTAYARSSDLTYAMVTVAPGLVLYPHPKWSIQLSPFIQAKSVNDSDQSAVAVGGKVALKQQWGRTYYSGEYVMYSDSKADADVYSFTEKAVGLYVGMNWLGRFFSEIGYEFARGDSYRSIGQISSIPVGQGKGRHYSQTFNEYIISEPVDRHTIGLSIGYDFSRYISSFISYTHTSYSGDIGTSHSHGGSFSIGYRF